MSSFAQTIKRSAVAGFSAGAALLLTYFLGLTLLQQVVLVAIITALLTWFYELLAAKDKPR